MTTIYQVVTTSGIVKGTFVFLDDAQEFYKNKRTTVPDITIGRADNKTKEG